MISLDDLRLDNKEKKALFNALRNVEEEVYVLGSRLDKGKRGGDIDLLIYSKRNSLNLSRQIAQRFFIECEEKIDVLVFNKDNLNKEQKAFISTLKMKRIK
jgi:uncharacterized protein